ncbi:MAG: biopolymer transporter ExbD [Akkermansiaceae bacterium]|nr:biopolymer transporter ExbD [Akkermansiaceae bacterium]
MNIYTRKIPTMGITIVPMLDILTILLIFFIVHTEFKRQVSVLNLDLPQTHNLSGEKGSNDSVLLEVGADGTLAFGGQIITEQQLPALVQEQLEKAPDSTIQVSAADSSSLGRFLQVLDQLTAAGLNIEKVPVRIDYKP